MALPPCGLYRTTIAIESVPADRLVMFHNHGEPGPGVYLPESWQLNRAVFSPSGTPLPDDDVAVTLEPLAPEGLYRVTDPFSCCAKLCQTFERDQVLQLGYNGAGEPIVFVPQWSAEGLRFPASGTRIDVDRVGKLAPLKLPPPPQDAAQLS